MKKFILLTLALLASITVNAQFIQGPSKFNALTNPATIPFIALGVSNSIAVSNTNIVVGAIKPAPVGANGVGIHIIGVSSTPLAITNMGFVFEVSGDGVVYSTNVLRVSYSPLGTNVSSFFTNITPAVYPNIGNVSLIRLRQILNTNSEAFTISNLVFTTR